MFRKIHVGKPGRTVVVRGLAAAGAAALVLGFASPASASSSHHIPHVRQVNQVSNVPGLANPPADPDVRNSWGLALSPTGPLWVANNGSNKATIFSGGLGGAPVGRVGLRVTIDGGAPTGAAFNDTMDFRIKVDGKKAPATFLFVSEDGDLTAWSGAISGTEARVVRHIDGASYKGLALVHTKFGPFLLATNFAQGRIDVFDKHFNLVKLPGKAFRDPKLPEGYVPFNVAALDDHVFVTYALRLDANEDEEHGAGLGFVDRYSPLGRDVKRIASRGTLNAPWGLAIAPKGFGKFSGALLVGNFGDGRINAFRGHHFLGQLLDTNNQPVTIDGLWALLPGTETTGGLGTLWFSAGPNDEADGLVGQLIPTRIH